MIDAKTRAKYTPTIGIECHVQLKTATKLFAAVGNDAREAAPNTLVSHICFGLPGALPVLNERALEFAMRFALAVNVEPQEYSYFERKHYFYPDLPKGYQITQLHKPIVVGGWVEIEAGGDMRRINLNRIQIEEDAGKNTHQAGKDYSLVDLNRAGTPLLEIVSEPEIHTAEEAKAYARELYLLARYTDVSDADMFHGNMRFDVNVSVSADPGKLGTRTETKNLNSFRAVERAVAYEIDRQIELLEKGQEIVQETRGWDEAKQKTVSQRGKEEAHDYRYFPDPDLPPVVVTPEMTEKVRQAMPAMPGAWRSKLSGLNLDKSRVEVLIDAQAGEGGLKPLQLIEQFIDNTDKAQWVANMLVNVEIPLGHEGKLSPELDDDFRGRIYRDVYDLVNSGKISATNAKQLLSQLLTNGAKPESIEKYAEEQGYIQVSDESAIESIVKEVIEANPQAADDVRGGEMKAIGFLVGQVMKKSEGRANPALAQQIIKKQLGA